MITGFRRNCKMNAVNKIKEIVDKEERDGARQIGTVVLMVAEKSDKAAELILEDLKSPNMSLLNCFEALKKYAKANAKDGFWGCMCNSFNKDNPIIKVVMDFYKIPKEWFENENPRRLGTPPGTAGSVDLLDLI